MKMHVKPEFFAYIQSGHKVVEGRLLKKKYAQLKPGDAITFFTDQKPDQLAHKNELKVEILEVQHFKSFLVGLQSTDYKLLIPQARSLEEAVSAYDEFYTQQDQAKYRVLLIHFKVV